MMVCAIEKGQFLKTRNRVCVTTIRALVSR
nr:MAG TPA_asm: hypothetical protein [Caudoviricetes sp.]